MRPSSFLFLLSAISFSCTTPSKAQSTQATGIPTPAATPTPDDPFVLSPSDIEAILAAPQPAATPVPVPTLSEHDCVNAKASYAAAAAKKTEDAKGWAYAAAYCDLSPGMSREAAVALFEQYHLEKQDWTKQGSFDEWWRWKWRKPQGKKTHWVQATTLEVEFRNDTLKKITLALTTPDRSASGVKGSL